MIFLNDDENDEQKHKFPTSQQSGLREERQVVGSIAETALIARGCDRYMLRWLED